MLAPELRVEDRGVVCSRVGLKPFPEEVEAFPASWLTHIFHQLVVVLYAGVHDVRSRFALHAARQRQ